ncbi:MAG: ATP-binding protein [Solirubrobacterales bacterium]
MADPAAVLSGIGLPASGEKQILPDSEGVFDAIARIGYEFEHAVADLVDNSIDAGASWVMVRFVHDGKAIKSVMVLDDGSGMSDADLDQAMTFGARTGRDETHLGKYGMGLKSASFSQCQVLTVVTKKGNRSAGRRWTAQKARAGWNCEIIERQATADYLNAQFKDIKGWDHGTLVEWGSLDALSHAMQPPDVLIAERFKQLRQHLGLVFHRFLEREEIKIVLTNANVATGDRAFGEMVSPLNPFPKVSGMRGYPCTFKFALPGGPEMAFDAYIWRRDAKDAGFKLGGRAARRQGIYAYRNDRLIQAGGWNGIRNDAEVHTSLARIQLDLPASLDAEFKPTVQKSAVSMPDVVLAALREARCGDKTFAEYLTDAEAAYRDQKPSRRVRHGLVPVSGINKPLAKKFERILGSPEDEEDEVTFRWAALPAREFFRLSPRSQEIILNSTYRDAVLQGGRASSGDAPLIKTLVMLLCRDDLSRKQRRQDHADQLEVFNWLLVEAVRSQQ